MEYLAAIALYFGLGLLLARREYREARREHYSRGVGLEPAAVMLLFWPLCLLWSAVRWAITYRNH